MRNVISFDSCNEFDEFVKDNCLKKNVGEGGEGKCYLSKDGKNVYKVFERFGCDNSPVVRYNVNEVITTSDIMLKRYVLPSELYALKGILVGYKAKYIKGEDLFSAINLTRFHDDRNLINFDALLKSYYEMEKETDMLSKERISLFDLTYNVMFVRNRLYGIDTCGYKRKSVDVFKSNREALEDSIKMMFDEWMRYDDYVYEQSRLELAEEKDMDKYIKKLSRVIKG